jgi:uncharacterized membrane protein HdeD (DUF308 family)
MRGYESFWAVTVLRGVLALLIGGAVFVVPDLARTLLFLPFAVAFAIVSLAVYGIADSVLVFVTSFFTSLEPARVGLRLQSACGIMIGVLFCSIFFDRIQMAWFLYLIAAQAFATACSEFLLARHTPRAHGSRWSYVAATIALLCCGIYAAAALLAPATLSPHEIATLAYAYLAAFGAAQTLMAMRMLYIERRAATTSAGESPS